MALVRISKKGDQPNEGEAVGGSGSSGVPTEFNRISSNITLADHIGRFVAGEVATQFKNENLADLLKGKNMIMISGSWG